MAVPTARFLMIVMMGSFLIEVDIPVFHGRCCLFPAPG
jgi:hypothetical protein